jgi:hypothetical protein
MLKEGGMDKKLCPPAFRKSLIAALASWHQRERSGGENIS